MSRFEAAGARTLGGSQLPPDRTERVSAGSVLVLAPHPDDEVLGCGGLLVQLARDGAAVRVLFLTDGAGGRDVVDDRPAYAARRRREAAAVAERLGFAGVEHLALPDGALAAHLDAAAAAVRRALLSQRPDLLLVPSPLEASADHRAAFAALHRLLAPLRPAAGGAGRELPDDSPAATSAEPRTDPGSDPGTEPLAEAVAGLAVLAYEINRPAYPDLLVDVGAELPELEAAMALYVSQGERRGYWRAASGLKRYRTLTLGSDADGSQAAEGYRRLAPADFATRSPAQLVAWLGGVPELHVVTEGPLVSVVVRTKDRPELLRQALASLAAGTWRRTEIVLVNDGGAPPELPGDLGLPVVRVDLPDNRGRAAAAEAGVAAAHGEYVAFLDDDDLAAPEHLETLVGLVGAPGVRVAYTDAAVAVYELAAPGDDGAETPGGWSCRERRLPYSRDFDPDLLLVDNYIPFHTLLVERSLFAEVGPFDRALPFFEDWDFLIRLAAVTPFHHLPRVTCEYRHFRGAGHHVLGESPRRRADFLAMKARVLAKHAGRLEPERLAAAVDTLRAELVAAIEAAAAATREARRARGEAREIDRERHRWEQAHHRVHGEVVGLREEREALRRELQRLYDDESALRRTVDEQTEHLGRTYAEIARLEGRIRAMEATRAWRLHQRLEGLRGAGEPGGS
ncbi:MAG TPA: PIG-L family deacetylase [Thermoanaerobaculia bacterium]|nr:PIG-L family deacetylase [Thermoanaerobaculia bacterium]